MLQDVFVHVIRQYKKQNSRTQYQRHDCGVDDHHAEYGYAIGVPIAKVEFPFLIKVSTTIKCRAVASRQVFSAAYLVCGSNLGGGDGPLASPLTLNSLQRNQQYDGRQIESDTLAATHGIKSTEHGIDVL